MMAYLSDLSFLPVDKEELFNLDNDALMKEAKCIFLAEK